MVGDLDRVAFDHDVEPFVPAVAASRQNHMWVSTKVDGLLFGVGSAEVDGPVVPHGNDRRDMRATIGPHRREPKHLGRFEHATRLLPLRDNSVRFAVSRVHFRDWFVHQKNSLRSFSDGGKVVSPGLSQGSSCFICLMLLSCSSGMWLWSSGL